MPKLKVTATPQASQPDEASLALIEQFLANDKPCAALPEDEAPHVEREEALLPGHQSGFVAIIGRPNVGKSTLLNALLAQKISIVSQKPQTTRTRIMGILSAPGYQAIFIDTPGIHKKPGFTLNKKMIDLAVSAIPDADVILFVVDVSDAPHEEDALIAEILKQKAEKRPVFFVLNKMDQLKPEQVEAHIPAFWALLPNYADSIPVSALSGTNIPLLRERVLERLPEGPRYFPGDQITDQTERDIAAELVREAMLRYTHKEIPHAAAVLVEDYETRENGVTYIDAVIWVERESQKPIVIGKQGLMLKRIGSAARQELERFIGGKVFLELWVKVKPKWRDQEARLRELGFK